MIISKTAFPFLKDSLFLERILMESVSYHIGAYFATIAPSRRCYPLSINIDG